MPRRDLADITSDKQTKRSLKIIQKRMGPIYRFPVSKNDPVRAWFQYWENIGIARMYVFSCSSPNFDQNVTVTGKVLGILSFNSVVCLRLHALLCPVLEYGVVIRYFVHGDRRTKNSCKGTFSPLSSFVHNVDQPHHGYSLVRSALSMYYRIKNIGTDIDNNSHGWHKIMLKSVVKLYIFIYLISYVSKTMGII